MRRTLSRPLNCKRTTVHAKILRTLDYKQTFLSRFSNSARPVRILIIVETLMALADGEDRDNQKAATWEQVRPTIARLAGAMSPAGNADDVLQDVYVAFLTKGPSEVTDGQARRWLIAVTVNACRNEHRKLGRLRTALHNLGSRLIYRACPSAADDAEAREQKKLIRQALDRLEFKVRSAIVMRYFMDMDSSEIAKILETSDSTIRGYLRQGRLKLAEVLRTSEGPND